ncbi:MAG: SGNH/GDSL hydrolase family protein, partial [Oscillospiraceae bacterium]|nr:SGNH/GDSL hydrolase family protein [Oscillospiraceae bacterium]
NIKVILMTPLHRNTLHRKEEFIRLASDSVYKGQTLYDFVSAIKAVGKKYNVTICDMFNESGLTMQNAKDYTFEGVHPHNKGYEFIIKPLIKAVKTTFNI